ncbi:unnamed protein product [Mytilus coruscus]|uniref:Copper transport protein n=1 Tax=Mytilus coruscus TaxID=42192 RepID=A0A6J8AVY3_MYTCO|nr:unnamed protein product [Mytilus coruscus]
MKIILKYFTTDVSIEKFLFDGISVKNNEDLFCVCIIVGLATLCLEGLRVLFLYLESRVRQHPLTYGQTDAHSQDKAPLFSSLLIPSSIESIRKRRLKYHCLAFITHTINVILGFLIMLAVMSYNVWIGVSVLSVDVMSYNVWIGVSVLSGAGLGHFLFGTVKNRIHLKYPTIAPSVRSNSSVQINTLTETPESDVIM